MNNSHNSKSVEDIFKQEEIYLECLDNNIQAPLPPAIFDLPNLSYPSGLEKIMRGIQREGELEEVMRILQIAEKTLSEYKNDGNSWKVWMPYPSMFRKRLKKIFIKNAITQPLYKHIYFSDKYVWAKRLYTSSLLLLVLLIVSFPIAFLLNYFLIPVLMAVFLSISVYFQVKIANLVFERTEFLDTYKSIYGMFEKTYRDHLVLVSKGTELSQFIEEQKIQFIKETTVDQKDIWRDGVKRESQLKINENLKKYELEGMERLKDLVMATASAQAKTEASVKKIQNAVSIDYQKGLEDINTRNQSTLMIIESVGRALVEQAKILSEEGAENRHLERQLNFLNEVKSKHQDENTSPEEMNDLLKKMMEMMQNPTNTKSKSSK